MYIRRLGSKHYDRHMKEQDELSTPGAPDSKFGVTPGESTPGAEVQMAMFDAARIDTEAPMMTDRPMLT